MTTPTADHNPARQLADLIGEDAARAAIQAGWDAIREMDRHHTTPTVHSGVADYVATIAILAAAPTIARHDDMFQRAYFGVQEVLDEALGTEEEDGAGMGIVADVRLLAQRYADLRKAVLTTPPTVHSHWVRTVAEIEASPLRCSHGMDVDDDCQQCIAEVFASMNGEGVR